jgi:6-phosphogluconolactonase (cycloisomerase 2 family)
MRYSLWKKINATLAALTLLGGLTACGGGGGGNPDATVAPASAEAPTSALPASLGTVPRFAYVANFGSSTVSIYQVDASTGQWRPHGYAVTGDRPSAVTVDPSGQFAYVTNYYGNSISAYAINASNGALTKVGDDVPTGQNPGAITIDAQHRFAYVSMGQAGAISTYAINAVSGALTKVGDDVPTGEGPHKLVIAPSGQFAYLDTRGAGTLLAFAIDAQTGALKQIGDATALNAPDVVAVDPGGKFVYALTDGGVIKTFGIDAHTGALTHEGDFAVAGFGDTGAFALVPSGQYGYVVNKATNIVSAFSVDSTTGVLTMIGDVATGQQPVAVTVDAKGQFAYVANGGDNTVTAYSIDASTGKLTNVGLVRAQLEPSSIAILSGQAAVSVTPQFVYTANVDANTISAYSVDANSGALTKISDLATDASPGIVAADPYGRFVYVAHAYDNAITAYSIDSTGALHKLNDVPADNAEVTAPTSLVVDPSGRFVYAGYRNSNNIQAYAIDAGTGNLKSAGLLFTTSQVIAMAVDPLGLFIYATTSSSNTVSAWRIDTTTGGLTAIDSGASAVDSPGILAIDPLGQYVHVVSGDTPVFIHTYTIDASSGQLVYVSEATDPSALSVRSFVVDPSRQFAYAVVYTSNSSSAVLSTYTISATGVLTKVNDVPFGSADAAPTAFAVDPTGRFAYGIFQLGFSGNFTGSTYSIDAITGALTKVSDLSQWHGRTYSVVVTGTTQ